MKNSAKSEKSLIGKRLQQVRERAHISVVDAAASLEVQPLAVERWERGAAMPSLVEFKRVLELYGVMACEVLFEINPLELPPDQAAELSQRAQEFTPGLRSRIDCFLAMFSRGKEPVWRKAA